MAAGVALALMATGTAGTRSSWTTATVASPGSTQSSSLAFSHAYQSTTCAQGIRSGATSSCSGSIAPTAQVTAGGVSASDAVTNNGATGSADLKAEVSASCAPVQLANRVTASNPMLPRNGTTFSTSGGPMTGSGYVSFNGSSGYAASSSASAQPAGGLIALGTGVAIGVWFKAAPGASGPLYSFGASPSNGSGSADRALYLDSAGRLNFTWNLSGTKTGPTSANYANNAWHFAYVVMSKVSVLGLGVVLDVTIYVDTVQRANSSTLLLTSFDSYSGYWHLGWAPTTATTSGLTTNTAVSLSNFVTFTSGSYPDPSTFGTQSTQAGFTTAAAGAAQRWLLDDNGTAVYNGTLTGTLADPCGKVTIDWTFAGPASTVASGTSLGAFADGTWRQVTAPGPGVTQTSTIVLKRGGSWVSDLAGLLLYAPLSYRVQTTPTGSPWVQTFTWAGSGAVVVA